MGFLGEEFLAGFALELLDFAEFPFAHASFYCAFGAAVRADGLRLFFMFHKILMILPVYKSNAFWNL